jgi:hypothetical protein
VPQESPESPEASAPPLNGVQPAPALAQVSQQAPGNIIALHFNYQTGEVTVNLGRERLQDLAVGSQILANAYKQIANKSPIIIPGPAPTPRHPRI